MVFCTHILFILGNLLASLPGDDCIGLFVEDCVIMYLLQQSLWFVFLLFFNKIQCRESLIV